MIIAIKDKKYDVHFGIKFIRELDKKNFLEADGAKFGAGLELKASSLYTYDTAALSEILYVGTCLNKSRPSVEDIDTYIENHEDLEGLFCEVISELKKGNATRLKMEQMEKNLQTASKK